MTFPYELTPDDYAALAFNTFAPGHKAGGMSWMTRYLFPAYLVVLTLLSYSARHRVSTMDIFFLLLAFAWATLLPRWYRRGVSRRMKKMAAAGMRKDALGYHELIVDEQGVTERTSLGSIQRNWSGLERVVQTPSHLFVYYGLHSAFIVPMSWLGTSADTLTTALAEGMAPLGDGQTRTVATSMP
jgi:hypothetical protein